MTQSTTAQPIVINFDALEKQGNEHLGAGLGLGALTTGSILVLGVTCPLCYVAAPALIASGLWKKHKASQGYRSPAERALERMKSSQ
ncbi:MAG: hypothetical protein ACNA8W_20750 [Bradymonadaceae bacterium]